MRVIHVITGDTWAGAEVQASALAGALAARQDVALAGVTFNDGILAASLRQQGIPVTIVPESQRGLTGLVRGCHRAFRAFRPDVVHVHGFKEHLVGGVAARLARASVVRTHHGRALIEVSRRHLAVERLNARMLTDATIAVSRDLADFLAGRGIRTVRMRVVLNGVEPPRPFAPDARDGERRELGFGPGAIVLGTAGRLVHVKAHSVFLQAAQSIAGEVPEARFLLIGDGPLMGSLLAMARDLGIEGRTVFAGFREDAARLLEALDVFVLTSRHEGVPMALLEAMGSGRPVVCSAVGGIPEVVTHHVNGWLVPPGDPAAVSRACLEAIRDEPLRRRLASQAADDVGRRFSLSVLASKTFAVYEEVLAG